MMFPRLLLVLLRAAWANDSHSPEEVFAENLVQRKDSGEWNAEGYLQRPVVMTSAKRDNEGLLGLFFGETPLESDKQRPITGKVYFPPANACGSNLDANVPSTVEKKMVIPTLVYYPPSNQACNLEKQMAFLRRSLTSPWPALLFYDFDFSLNTSDPLPSDISSFFSDPSLYSPQNATSLILFRAPPYEPFEFQPLPEVPSLQEGEFLHLYRYRVLGLKDPANALLIGFAMLVVSLAAFFAVYRPTPRRAARSDLRIPGQRLSDSADASLSRTPSLAPSHVVSFLFVASASLIFLFFTLSYLYYPLILVYCAAGVQSSAQLFSVFVWNCCPCLRYCLASRHTRPRLYRILGRVRASDVPAALPGTAAALLFCLFHGSDSMYQFIGQNALGLLVCCAVQQQLRLPSFRLGVAFLGAMFFFDIF